MLWQALSSRLHTIPMWLEFKTAVLKSLSSLAAHASNLMHRHAQERTGIQQYLE